MVSLNTRGPEKNSVFSKRKFLGGSVLIPFREVCHVSTFKDILGVAISFSNSPWREVTVPKLVH